MSSQMTLPVTPRSISSPGSADGPTPSRLPDGPPTGPSGPDRARASRSRSPDAAQAPVTNGTYGPTCFASSVPPGPLSCWESRLRDRLAMAGSMEFPLIWSEKVTPAGRLISRLAPSTRRTSDSDCIGALWGTPCANPDGSSAEAFLERKRRGSRMGGTPLTVQMYAWSTPTTNDAKNNAASSQFERNSAALNVQMAAATWPTPRVSAGKGAGNATRGLDGGNCRLEDTIAMAAASGTPTPSSPATTAKRGVPNPQFPCWLMGFPAVWPLGMDSATRLSRRSPPKSSKP